MGHARKWKVAKQIYDAVSSPRQLDEIADRMGKCRYDPECVEQHDRYMLAFLTNFNRGKPKQVCSRWLKAPGGQLFFWGRLPRFRGQEPVKRLRVHYREEVFDGTQIVTLRNELIKTIEIPLAGDITEQVCSAYPKAA